MRCSRSDLAQAKWGTVGAGATHLVAKRRGKALKVTTKLSKVLLLHGAALVGGQRLNIMGAGVQALDFLVK